MTITIKSLFLGSALAVFAAGAYAQDQPTKDT